MTKKSSAHSPHNAREWREIKTLASEKGKISLTPEAALKKLCESDVLKDFKEFKRDRAKRQPPLS